MQGLFFADRPPRLPTRPPYPNGIIGGRVGRRGGRSEHNKSAYKKGPKGRLGVCENPFEPFCRTGPAWVCAGGRSWVVGDVGTWTRMCVVVRLLLTWDQPCRIYIMHGPCQFQGLTDLRAFGWLSKSKRVGNCQICRRFRSVFTRLSPCAPKSASCRRIDV